MLELHKEPFEADQGRAGIADGRLIVDIIDSF